MTNNRVYSIDDYKFSQVDAVLFDANIWLYIYGPQGDSSPWLKATYTLALRRIRSVRGRILLDGFILSEFINAYARFFYNKLSPDTKPPEFKFYRHSHDFKSIAEQIAIKTRRMLSKSERIESGFSKIDLEPILNDYQSGGVDFNDRILAELCKENNLKLVTHDADFKGHNLIILTANPNLLN